MAEQAEPQGSPSGSPARSDRRSPGFGSFTICWRCHSEPGKCNFTLRELEQPSASLLPPASDSTGLCGRVGLPLLQKAGQKVLVEVTWLCWNTGQDWKDV